MKESTPQREHWRRHSAKWRKNHPGKVKEIRKSNMSSNRAYQQKRRDTLRIEVLTHYGPAHQLCCSWADCHISDPDMLVLDHIANDGAKQRKVLGLRGWNFYAYLKRLMFPAGFQTLCCNHNHKKELICRRQPKLLDYLCHN